MINLLLGHTYRSFSVISPLSINRDSRLYNSSLSVGFSTTPRKGIITSLNIFSGIVRNSSNTILLNRNPRSLSPLANGRAIALLVPIFKVHWSVPLVILKPHSFSKLASGLLSISSIFWKICFDCLKLPAITPILELGLSRHSSRT